MPPNDSDPGTASSGVATDERLGGGCVTHTVARLDDLRPIQLRAWASACHHLRAAGVEPMPPEHVRRALARRRWFR